MVIPATNKRKLRWCEVLGLNLVMLAFFLAILAILALWVIYVFSSWTSWTPQVVLLHLAAFTLVGIPMAVRILAGCLEAWGIWSKLLTALDALLRVYKGFYIWLDGAGVIFAAISLSFLGALAISTIVPVVMTSGAPPADIVNASMYLSVTYTAWSFSYRGDRHIRWMCRVLRDKGTSETTAKRMLTSLTVRKRVYQVMIPFYIFSTVVSFLGPYVPSYLMVFGNRPILESLLTLIVIDSYASSYKPSWAQGSD